MPRPAPRVAPGTTAVFPASGVTAELPRVLRGALIDLESLGVPHRHLGTTSGVPHGRGTVFPVLVDRDELFRREVVRVHVPVLVYDQLARVFTRLLR